MAYFNGTIFSESLGMMTDIAVILPENRCRCLKDGTYPVLYLLHGLSDNHSAWSRRTMVELYAEETGIAVVMPEVQRSFYTDMAYGIRYFTFIADELPRICRDKFRISNDPRHTFIAGLSMGGYGALKTAMTYPERFAAAAGFSSVTDIIDRIKHSELISKEELFGIIGDKGVQPSQDLFELSKSDKAFPPLYITCGTEDFMIEDNRRFHAHLQKIGVPHIYEEWTGGHNWAFWNTSAEKAMRFFVEQNDKG
ncbi:MAG: esterase family protein [Clostridia bacterium]|nr:esterase family protein [Clostridia bacterium]